MEARQITIVSSRTQAKKVIMSGAETLGELKHDLDANGIDYDGLAFFEGISKSELKDNEAILPKNLPWKGQITNNLVFMLTEPQKKIKNGAVSSRTEAYNYIKSHNLQQTVVSKFGKNFTQCKTDELVALCNNHGHKAATAKSEKLTKTVNKPAVASRRKAPMKPAAVRVATATPTPVSTSEYIDHNALVSLLITKGIISLNEATTGKSEQPVNTEFSDSEISAMFKNVK